MNAKAVKALWDKYQALTSDQRVMESAHLLPPPLPGKCLGCGKELPLFQVRWSQIESAAKGNSGLPETLDRRCDKCDEEEEDDEEEEAYA